MSRHFEATAPKVTVATTANTYASGQQIDGPQKLIDKVLLASLAEDDGGSVILESISVVDLADQKSDLAILFFDSPIAPVSLDNQPLNLSNSDALKCIGVIKVSSANYVSSSGQAFACVPNIKLVLKALKKVRDIYYIVIAQGAATYTVNCLQFTFGVKKP